MRILQIGMSYNPGGVESFIISYYRELVRKGVQFDFVCMYSCLAYEEEIRKLGGRIFYTSDVKKNTILFVREFKEILCRNSYDVVHVNMLSAANIVPLKVAKQCGVKKIIAHSHNSSTPGLLRNVLHRINRKRIENYATDFYACSEAAGNWLFPDQIINKNKVVIINNAIEVERFLFDKELQRSVRKELGLEEDKLVIGHVGRFEEQKNHTFLIDIFYKIVQKNPKAVLLLVGTGELEPSVREKVKAYRLEEHVRFLGVRNDVPRLWQVIDVFLFPSLFEGLPIVAIEAQAAGVACVLADTITKETVITGGVKFLSLSSSSQEWAECIMNLEYIKSTEQNKCIYKKFCEKGFEIQGAADKLLEYYQIQYS